MLDEEMDHMIREATAQHHPEYDNTSWDKMKLLLDKHLPQKKRRWGFMPFLFLSLLIGGTLFFAGYYFTAHKKSSTDIAEAGKEKGSSIPANPATVQPLNSETTDQNTSSPSGTNHVNNVPGNDQGKHLTLGNTVSTTNVQINPGSAGWDDNSNKTAVAKDDKLQQNKTSFEDELRNIVDANSIGTVKKDMAPANSKTESVNSPVVQQSPKTPAGTDIVKETPKEKSNETVAGKGSAVTDKRRSKNSIADNIGFSVSAGPDISFVELNKPGKVTLTYGLGLSYTFLKKLTLQAGLYVSKKIYSSDSANYHPPSVFWTYYPNMQKIDANCKVYEVPVNLLYNFGKKGNHQWYAGAGLSSYFMKSETYDYTYKYYGQNYSKTTTINNENQHNFSVLTLTGGYQYDVSKRVSVSAAPYFKLPLAGIGFGKVQLKGGGVLFNATVKPFGKKNKK